MSDPAAVNDNPSGSSPDQGPIIRDLEICNKKGLHARASAKFVKLASGFDAEVRVSKDGQTVDARSIMGLMMLAAGPGTTITVRATGAQAAEVIEALSALVCGRFTEEE